MLDNALDWGLTEEEFWSMTFDELERWRSSRQRQEKLKAKEKATFDYTLALLIGRAFRGADDEHPFPDLYEIYPNLFLEERQKQLKEQEAQNAQISAIRFIQFAESFNQNFNEEANE